MAAVDKASAFLGGLTAPAEFPEPIINDVECSFLGRGIYVGVGGDVNLVRSDNVVVLFKNAVAGSIIPARAKKVLSAGTSATNLVNMGP